MKKLSICTTSYNCDHSLRKHLESIYDLFSPLEFEYIVVDNISEDNTRNILEEFSSKYKNMKIISKKCTRGIGRRIAFENSSCDIIAQVDCDVSYNISWKAVIYWFIEHNPEFAVVPMCGPIFPKKVLKEIDSWQNLQQGEDLDVYFKLLRVNKVKFTTLNTGNALRDYRTTLGKSKIHNVWRIWRDLHDMFLLGRLDFWGTIKASPPPKVASYAGIISAKFVSMVRKIYWPVIDIGDYNRKEIQENTIELEIQGEYMEEPLPGLQFAPIVPSNEIISRAERQIYKGDVY
jgi:glycosyltransferase involved in cell wall biosynthesis